MPILIIPDATHGSTNRPIIYQNRDPDTKVLTLWASGTIRILTKNGKAVVNALDMTPAAPVADALLWFPVWGSDTNQIPHPEGGSVVYLVQFSCVVASAPSGKNVHKSVEREWTVRRSL